ncbi:sugar lactone lactonase YvrE [Paraburkholderia sp. RAU6.4a]|uniref:SMP-30/gluconolactonase/LRE family protein n=1 Tax=Paraburkholderia sp. RAU6.4a TaxID=2991067 RepID=UPI003D1F706F
MIDDTATSSARAASEKLPASTTATNTSRSLSIAASYFAFIANVGCIGANCLGNTAKAQSLPSHRRPGAENRRTSMTTPKHRKRPAQLISGMTLAAALLAPNLSSAADITFTAPQAFPESITWSARQHVFMVGSVRHGTVGKITPDGHYSEFIHDDRLISTLGLFVDDRRNTLWVTNSDPGVGEHTNAATKGKLAAIATYDATTGEPRAYYDLSSIHPGAHLANDLAVDADGNVYVTDSFAPIVYRIDTRGQMSAWARDPRFHTGEGFNLNGIAMHPDRYLIIGNYNSGALFKIDIHEPSRIEQITLPEALKGADGFDLVDSQHLVVVQNEGIDRTVELVSTDGWRTATIERVQKSERSMPTAAVTENGKTYVLNSRIDTLFKPGSPQIDQFVLQQF